MYLASNTIDPLITPEMDKMSFRLRTPCDEYSYPLTEIDKLLDSPEFDVNKKVAILVVGWLYSSENEMVTEMAEAFKCRDDYNFLVI